MISNDVGTSSWLVEELAAARVIERDLLEPHLADFNAECPYADADAFAKHLAREGVLSKYQARRAVDGDARKLILGAYLVVEVIGSGSLGPVYKALGRADQKPYAVKVLPRRAWNVRLARSQVRAFEDLPPHEGIVPFVDVGTAHGLHYLVWPFAEGRTLQSLIREHGPLSPGEVARIGVRLAEVLKMCLTRGLIHGFIKPSNVLVTDDGQARLLDFGIGALMAENAEDELLVDTVSRAEVLAQMLECAAPESIADSSKWLPAGDQYSLGCTLYFTATGRFPFPVGNFVEKIIHHQSHKPAPIRTLNPDIPPGLADVIDRLMSKAASDRYPRLEELIGELAPLATVSRVQQPVPVNVETPAPKARLQVAPAPADVESIPEAHDVEPSLLELPMPQERRGMLGRMFAGRERADDTLCATVVAAGPVERGSSAVLHVYIHSTRETPLLAEAARRQHEHACILGTGQTRREIDVGSKVGLHLAIAGATVGEPLQEFERPAETMIYRFSMTIPNDGAKVPLNGRLMIGQEGKLIAQVDFVVPVAAG